MVTGEKIVNFETLQRYTQMMKGKHTLLAVVFLLAMFASASGQSVLYPIDTDVADLLKDCSLSYTPSFAAYVYNAEEACIANKLKYDDCRLYINQKGDELVLKCRLYSPREIVSISDDGNLFIDLEREEPESFDEFSCMINDDFLESAIRFAKSAVVSASYDNDNIFMNNDGESCGIYYNGIGAGTPYISGDCGELCRIIEKIVDIVISGKPEDLNQLIPQMSRVEDSFKMFYPTANKFNPIRADSSIVSPDDDVVPYHLVEEKPYIEGIIGGYSTWLNDNLDLSTLRERDVYGRITFSFFIEKDGAISNVRILSGLDPIVDEEVVSRVSEMPKSVPGYMNGEPVRVSITMVKPINDPQGKSIRHRGYIVDMNSLTPIQGAKVTVNGALTLSDSSGQFSLFCFDEDPHAVVECAGYSSRHVVLQDNSLIGSVIRLSPEFSSGNHGRRKLILDLPDDIVSIGIYSKSKSFEPNQRDISIHDSVYPDSIVFRNSSGEVVHSKNAHRVLRKIRNHPIPDVQFSEFELDNVNKLADSPVYLYVRRF